MPVPKHKPITSSPEGSTPQSSTPIAPDQEEFRQYLRRLAVSAVQVAHRTRTDRDVRGWDKHATSVGEVAQTLLGVARSRQHDQSPQPDPDATI